MTEASTHPAIPSTAMVASELDAAENGAPRARPAPARATTLFPADHPDVRNDLAHLGAVGDGQTVALIDDRAAMRYLCWPLLDSPSVFAGLLREDRREALYPFADRPVVPVSQRYRGTTDILETVVEIGGARVTITDMPARPPLAKAMIRRMRAHDRPVRFATIARVGFDYGRATHEVCSTQTLAAANTVVLSPDCSTDSAVGEALDLAIVSPDTIAAVGSRHRGPDVVIEHALEPDGETWIALSTPGDMDRVNPDLIARTEALLHAQAEQLEAQCTFRGEHRAVVLRSAAHLLLLEHHRHRLDHADGAKPPPLAAAATFSLPEAHGGERNYDYRFSWVRDTGLAVDAMAKIGLGERALRWLEFAVDRNGPSSREPLALMRTLDACDVPGDESQPDGFTGLYDAGPVRVGNAAAGQLQLDIFGAVLVAAHTLQSHGIALQEHTTERLRSSLDWVAENWNTPDASIWEMRTGEEHYLFSRLMCWVALDRGIAMLLAQGQPERFARWERERDAIRTDIETRFWCPATDSYMQTPQFAYVDAASIFMRVCGFLSANHPRWRGTKRAVRRKLHTVTGLLRYPREVEDGFSSEDNPFVLCTCWWIEALVMDGEMEEARLTYAMLLDRLGPTGLMSEEIDEQGRLMGNIPQAFSHAGLINAALALARGPEGAGGKENGTGG